MKTRVNLIPVIPAMLTLGNLACGFVAIAKAADAMQWSGDGGAYDPAFAHHITRGCWFVVAGMVFDAFDGRIARLTHHTSPFGAMLDSLADMVTFGLAPAFLAKVAYEHTVRELGVPFRSGWITLLCALFVIGAALRLARYTVGKDEEDSHDTFLGLPSPAAAATLITACFFIFDGRYEVGLGITSADALGIWVLRALPGMAAVMGLLMVTRIQYVHIVQRYIVPHMSVPALIRLVLVLWLVIFFHEWSLFALALAYVFGGMVLGLVARARGKSAPDTLPSSWERDEEEIIAP